MPNNYFRFKQFTIYQDKCAMKVGTDGVLLGAWTNCENAKNVLDIGTGTGLIALMVAQRSNADIEAIEIDETACMQAGENVDKTLWKSRVKIIHKSLNDYLLATDKKFDLIVSNPPYFQNSLYAPEEKRTNARHNALLEYDDIIEAANKLLDEEGTLSLVLPYLEGNMFILKASENNLFCVRQTKVLPNPGKQPKRLLLEFMKRKMPLVEQEIIIELNKRHEYSDAYKNLTKDFYLAF